MGSRVFVGPGGECWVDVVVVADVVAAAGMALLSLEQCNIKVRWLHILFGVVCGIRCSNGVFDRGHE